MGYHPPLITLPRHVASAGACPCRCHVAERGDYESEIHRAVVLAMVEGSDCFDAQVHAGRALQHKKDAERREDGRIGTDASDVLEAASACPACQDGHCAALSGKPEALELRRLPPPRPAPEPWTDAPRPPVTDGGSTLGDPEE